MPRQRSRAQRHRPRETQRRSRRSSGSLWKGSGSFTKGFLFKGPSFGFQAWVEWGVGFIRL